jgi:predicted ATP-grasp superfamily ATP-dependent carboligase
VARTYMKKSPERKHRILVLDGGHKSALAIVRHLGKTKKYHIDLVSYSKISIAYFSKYCSKKFIIRNPRVNPDDFISDLLTILKNNTYLVVIPVSYISYQLCSENKDEILKYTHITITTPENIKLASSKTSTYNYAEKLGVLVPDPIIINKPEEIASGNIEFPCVIKAPFEAGKNNIQYAYNKDELIKKYKVVCGDNDFKGAVPIIQKYIRGDGAGFFAFYKNGKCINYFIHRRLREYPVTGGSSTAAESFFDEDILKYGKLILDNLHWEGVAMVEFKQDSSTGKYYLMEINAKFWGSLDLALVSGVNFPQMLIDDALGKDIEKVDRWKKKRFQWILNGDLFHLIERPLHCFSIIRDLFIAKNDFYITDPGPNIFQLIFIPVHYYKKLFK